MKNGLEIDKYGDKRWYKNDLLHREDGPAVEWAGGSKFWYLNGKRHREDGPAAEWAGGYKAWYYHNKFIGRSDEGMTNEKFIFLLRKEKSITINDDLRTKLHTNLLKFLHQTNKEPNCWWDEDDEKRANAVIDNILELFNNAISTSDLRNSDNTSQSTSANYRSSKLESQINDTREWLQKLRNDSNCIIPGFIDEVLKKLQ